jgi:hypothetical protein
MGPHHDLKTMLFLSYVGEMDKDKILGFRVLVMLVSVRFCGLVMLAGASL